MLRRGVVVVALGLVACPRDPPAGETTAGSDGASTGPPAPGPTTGGPTSSGGPPTTGETTGASTTGAVVGSSGESSGGSSESSGGSSSEDTGESSSGEASSTGEPAELFDCFGCMCDARDAYCHKVFARAGARGDLGALAGSDERLCALVEPDGPESGCVLFGRLCPGRPSCECLPLMGGDCYCTEVEAGKFEVVCPLR